MTATKISVTWDDLNSDQVEKKIERQDALHRTRDHYRNVAVSAKRPGWCRQSAFYMAMFGLVGGLLAWIGSETFTRFFPDPLEEIRQITAQEKVILQQQQMGRITMEEKGKQLKTLYAKYPKNDYLAVVTDTQLKDATRQTMMQYRWERYQLMHTVRQIIWLAIIAVGIAVPLSMGDQLMCKQWQGAIVKGATALIAAVIGALVVSLFINRIYGLFGADAVGITWTKQIIARGFSFAFLGLFLCIVPGIVLRDRRRMLMGMVGGFIGGLVGGMLFDPISAMMTSGVLSRLAAVVAIGVGAGVGTGLIETVGRTGWLRVERGLIAGKQFILYRNPTYIGSSPQCEIYLFNNRGINAQHAAIHLIAGGFEIQDLNDEPRTTVNDQPVSRARLRKGDRICVGDTTIVFQEKRQLPTLG